jgi:hypothetical protein
MSRSKKLKKSIRVMEMTDDQKLEAREAKRKIKKEYRKTPKK